MEALPRAEFDATSVEPDGHLEIVYKSGPTEHVFFRDIKRWFWRRGDSTVLVIVFQNGSRSEIPELGIRRVNVMPNSEGYVLCQDFLKAAAHVDELENHLKFASGKMLQKRKEMLEWHATSSSR
jgi:hypothetical protein